MDAAECQLHVKLASVERDLMRLSYEFVNATRLDAYLFNRIWREIDAQGRYVIDPNLAYVLTEVDRVVLAKKIIPVPVDIDVEKPILPCVTHVEPGKRFAESMEIPLPLAPWTPYSATDSARNATATEMQAWFEVGYFLAGPATAALVRKVKTTQGEGISFAVFNPANQRELRSGPLAARIPVHR